MLGVVVDTASPGVVLREHRLTTPLGAEAVMDGIVELFGLLDPPPGTALGIGVPGLVDRRDTFRFGPNLPAVADISFGAALRERLGIHVVADNDATCAAMAEFHSGAGRGHANGVLLTIGTGIGGGLFLDGRIRHGANGFAGEPGHMLVDPTGPRCPCGRRGCWERFASGSGLGRLGRDAAIAGRFSASVALAGGDTEAVRGEHVVDAARGGDADAGTVLDEFAWWLAAGIANLIDLLDPSVVVLGGGVMDAADVLLDRIRASLVTQVLAHAHRPPVSVVVAERGARAGAVGAALLTEEGALAS